MRSLLLVLAGLGAAAAVLPANAADDVAGKGGQGMPFRGMAAPYSWSGLYAGLNIGAGFGSNSVTTTGQVAANVNNVNGGARPALTSVDRMGVIGGGQIGADHQFRHIVLGLEADLAGTGIGGKRTIVTTALTGGASLNNVISSSLTYLGTARGRAGIAAGRVLLYGTGGLAYGESVTTANLFGPSPANVVQFTAANSSTQMGFTVGGGGELRLSRHVSGKAEYLYYRLGEQTLNVAVIPGSGGGGTGYNTTFQNKGNIARLGINYRF